MIKKVLFHYEEDIISFKELKISDKCLLKALIKGSILDDLTQF